MGSFAEGIMNQEINDNEWNQNDLNVYCLQAFSKEFVELFCVNVNTGTFIWFHTDERTGKPVKEEPDFSFFDFCRNIASTSVIKEDREAFLKAMDPSFFMEISKNRTEYNLVCGRIIHGTPVCHRMRMTVSEADPDVILLSVSETDEWVKEHLEYDRIMEERTVYNSLQALTGNFICVYIVDPETESYHEFSSTHDYEDSFHQERSGEHFFDKVAEEARRFTHPDDLDRFLAAFSKLNILEQIERIGFFTIGYRLITENGPLHVQMKATLVKEKEGMRLIVGLNENTEQYRQKQINKEVARQKEIYDQITASLAEQYDTLYYIDIKTGTYTEISSTDEYKKLNVPATGNDFFAESRRSIRRYVHPEDQEMALSLHYPEVMLNNLKYRNSYSVAYRLVLNGNVRHIRHTEIMAKDEKHILVCIENIDEEVQAQLALQADQKKGMTFTRIAERLADHYDLIYYIDCSNSNYAEFSTRKKSGELKVKEEGSDFFATSLTNIDRLIYVDDRERIRHFLDRDHLISQLENSRQLIQDYRMNAEGGKTQYTRMSVTYSSDHSHFIICVENRDNDVRREQEHLAQLSMANELARRDELTHTKNKTAYREMEKELQRTMEEERTPFGIVICDINGLKVINDTEGHKAGDDYIKDACMLICRIFDHSPVFRIGGDEFAVVLRNRDYTDREKLISALRKQSEENQRIGEGPVIASGLAEYSKLADHSVEDVFNRADSQMYADKERLKQQKRVLESHSSGQKAEIRIITDERRNKLDSLYRAFAIVSEGTYVYLCDMKYDYSRWAKNAVDTFGLPSEYMYGAGDIWENRIHPEDRGAYRKGINAIFSGKEFGHDMQYRAMRTSGEYDVCTCRGIVIRDPLGEPDYFVGTIRNHNIQGHIDTLTGFRNQYGFFEDLDGWIKRKAEIAVLLIGIGSFSEVNEMYGYHFGNRVLQLYARKLHETIGNHGHTYRIDGTKFAVISNSMPLQELKEKYEEFRACLHEDFRVDGKNILLNLNCGALRVMNYDVDSQTVYACLNFAYTESKVRHQGDLVEFRNEEKGASHLRLEQLHAIRSSIMHGCQGFSLFFQPVVDAQSEQLIGAEALLRWENETYGMVPPDQFIPILESDPLFPELGEWIIREAILAAKQFLIHDPDFVINVNLSYTQLEKPDFTDMVLRILADLKYPPEHLCFEVTERCRLMDLNLLKNVLVSLKSRGIIIALDDFGTGFSSIGILKEIPVSVIKIDRSFVRCIEKNEVDRKIMNNISDLALIFSAKVCVEGIETEGMRDILKKLRVESFQGYYYAKPLRLEKFLEWQMEQERKAKELK